MIDEEMKLKRLSQAIEEDMTENELFEIARERRYRINDLQEENAELKEELRQKSDTNHSLVEQLADKEIVISELNEQNEKMKCCGNCKHLREKHNDNCIFIKSLNTIVCNKWELAE